MEKGVAFPLQWLPVMAASYYDYDYEGEGGDGEGGGGGDGGSS